MTCSNTISVQKRAFLHCWPVGFVRRRSKNLKRYRAFADDFSKVLAEEAAGKVWVVAPPSPTDPGRWVEPDTNSVWARTEFPALKSNPKVTQIWWVNSTTRVGTLWWTPPVLSFCFQVKCTIPLCGHSVM